uniref:Autophagy-related protein n=1 Tax=Cafeteria roenbergensis TaxID=33653 RepID=A0A7S0JMM2_CAFRO|mmetsp:Transcript_11005/g.42558  ORF Transcript_11005/g.42558 Transcript_11005/m.42558 type:complete len:690 (+) Transcript_11005:1114-3183(+)
MQSPPRAAAPLHAGSFRAFRRQMRPPGRRAHTICWCPLRRRILRHARPGRPPCARFARRFMQSPGALRDWRQMPALKHLATPPSGSALALAMSTGVVNPKPSPAGGGGAPAALVPASAGSQADAVDGALPAADAETDPDHPPVTQRELRGWYAFDAGSSAVSTVVISGFWPLLVQDTAIAASGFPEVCPNVIRNATFIAEALGVTTAEVAFRQLAPTADGCVGDVCPGLPATVSQCLEADGSSLFPLRVNFAGTPVEPTSFASAAISLSVILQVAVFISLGAYADHGRGRLTALKVLTLLGGLLCFAMFAVNENTWWLGGIFGALINVLYGATFVAYNAWLPQLAAKHPTMLGKVDAGTAEGKASLQYLMDELSGKGFMWGYIGSVVCMAVCVGFTIFLPSSLAYPLNMAFAGAWWLAFAVWTFATLEPRPGPPLPAGVNPIAFSWRRMFATVSRARHLPQLWWMLGLWFLYSDGFNIVASVGALYANSEVEFGFSRSTALAILIILSPIMAAIGNAAWLAIAKRFDLSARTVVILNLCIIVVVPVWGLLGFATTAIGLRHGWELFVGIAVYGFNLGAVQSFSRSLFASLVPRQQLSELFALYEITDKGSSWLGPLIVALVQQASGTLRLAFIYILVMLVVPALGLLTLDVASGHRQAIAMERVLDEETVLRARSIQADKAAESAGTDP